MIRSKKEGKEGGGKRGFQDENPILSRLSSMTLPYLEKKLVLGGG